MSMQYPHPRDNNGAYAKWQANEPMITVHPNICHGLASDTTIRAGNSFNVGDTINIDLYGSASHLGGHCAFWYSIDDITFTKIIDIKDCTLNPTTVTLPATMPTECATKCTFAFTWIPRVSGACEIYMNCADIQVQGALGGKTNPIQINFQSAFIENNNQYGCVRVDDTTHFSTVFGALQTEVDSSQNGNDIVNDDKTVSDKICYIEDTMAINLENNIDNNGICGNGATDNRCDDGMCCSSAGYCGPDWDGQGYKNYDEGGYYANSAVAFEAYCMNAVGDWRVRECDDQTTSDGYYVGYAVGVKCLLLFVFCVWFN